ncbi:MAG: UDP-N-acetylmuramoyl-tripeptide--D-alanyl-D-alanine ligase [Armatimonadota bacterium]
MTLPPERLASILGVPAPPNAEKVSGLAVDSREVKPGDLFCAVRGANVDGHDYAEAAMSAGAAGCLVTRDVGVQPAYIVPDVAEAMASIASAIRDDFKGTVIGITGSAGKTSTKEYLSAALAPFGKVLKSEGNQNTEFGLPMTWMRLDDEHRFVVLEMAMRGLGQIRHLCSFSRPHHGIITSIGTAHIGELGGSPENILRAKLELFESLPEDGVRAYPAEGAFAERLAEAAGASGVSFGEGEEAYARFLIGTMRPPENRTEVLFLVGGQEFAASLPGLGRGMMRNACAALALVSRLGVSVEEAVRGMERATLPPDRLTYVSHQTYGVLVDVYNSSPESCMESLRTLAEVPADRRIAVLGEMKELGEESEAAHRRVGAAVAELPIAWLAVVGREAHWIREEALARGFEGRVDAFTHAEDAARVFRSMGPGDVALIKGSRAVHMERALEEAGVAYAV